MNPRHPQIAERAAYRCEYCHAPEVVSNFSFEIEHVVPSVHAGTDEETNLALSCRSCNAHKAVRISALDPHNGAVVRLFHPRMDMWEQHFDVDIETALVAGLTPIGRATVVCLDMNSPAQCAARRQWMRLDLFP